MHITLYVSVGEIFNNSKNILVRDFVISVYLGNRSGKIFIIKEIEW